MIGFLRVFVVAIPATIWYGIRIVWGARGKDGARVCDELPRAWARTLLRAAGVEVELENPERIDPARPQILVANHASWVDVLALTVHVPGAFRFVAKKELARIPFFGAAWQACGHIAIDRSDRQAAIRSLTEAREILEREHPTVILFPEGTRSRDGRLLPFKKGAFVLAIQTGTEVVPAAILGSRAVMRKGSFLVYPGTVRIRFGEPMGVEGLELEDRGVLTDRARAAVAGLLDAGPAAPEDPKTIQP